MTIPELYQVYIQNYKVSTDTRKIERGCIYFALKGANFNGNQFAQDAIEKGAVLAVVDEEQYANNNDIVLFSNGLKALQDLALYHRNQLKIPVIGLTGSNGKTTTKELINAVLSQQFTVCFTKGNLNNHIGVPLTLLSIEPEHELAIIEMGANHQKEIQFLSNLSQPDIGYITNFGKAHLEGFGGVEGVIKGKSELYDYLRSANKTALVNLDNEKQIEKSEGIERIGFGADSEKYMFRMVNQNQNFVSVGFKENLIHSQLTGDYNFHNICAAITLGLHFGIDIQKIKVGVESYQSENNRSQIIKKENQTIILDAYNANPSSMELAIKNFKTFEGTKTVILGDMFELGDEAKVEHQNIINLCEALNFDFVLCVGENFKNCEAKQNLTYLFKEKSDLENYLKSNWQPTDNLLIKGSRGMSLESLLNSL